MPVQVDNGNVVTFLVFVSSQPNPAPPEAQRQAALQALQKQWLDKTISDRVDALGKEGKITYEPGYTPPAATPTPRASSSPTV